jgi:hypothetical protein
MTLEEEVSIIVDYLIENGIIRKQHFTRADDRASSAAAVAN